MEWLWIAVLALVLSWMVREHFVDKEFKVTRPDTSAVWKSKIDAQSPIGADDDAYVKVLQQFYDTVYVPAQVKPTDKDVEAFVKGVGNQPGIDVNSLRKIIVDAFHVDITVSSAAREEAEIRFQPNSANLQPEGARDEVYPQTEELYVPADSRMGDLPEGIYKPVEQTEPTRTGEYDDKSTSWRSGSFFHVCTRGACTQNVL